MISKSILNPEAFVITDELSQQNYNGCDQEWYHSKWKRLSGCAPTVASNLIYYLNKSHEGHPYKKYLSALMEDVWKYVTPSIKGVNSIDRFCKGVLSYSKSKGLNVQYRYINLPRTLSQRPSLLEIIAFIEGGLARDIPVAFLNLCNGKVDNLYSWHWVTIISIEYAEDMSSTFIDIMDEGIVKHVNLKLWSQTTTRGGGFVYIYI